MMFHESMVIPSLYTSDEQLLIERWMQSVPVYPGRDALADSSSVAEIALSSAQGRLPHHLSIKSDGSATIDRKTWACPVPMRNKLLLPIYLFEVGRDDSGLEILYPESYFATFLPGYNIYVVTVSQASSISYGYFDVAIDFFEAIEDTAYIASNARLTLKAWWRFQQKELHKLRWKELLQAGLIDATSALRLRDAVWNKVASADVVLS
jgi:hypothetical protein